MWKKTVMTEVTWKAKKKLTRKLERLYTFTCYLYMSKTEKS